MALSSNSDPNLAKKKLNQMNTDDEQAPSFNVSGSNNGYSNGAPNTRKHKVPKVNWPMNK